MTIKDLLKDSYREGMSAEDLAALLNNEVDLPDSGSEVERLKKALDKSNSDAASWKKQYRDTLSESERKAQEDAEKFAKLEEAYKASQRKEAINEEMSGLIAIGYSTELAKECAEALIDGDTAKYRAGIQAFKDGFEKSLRASLLDKTPSPVGGSSAPVMTKDKFNKMTPQERWNFRTEHPEEYEKMYE